MFSRLLFKKYLGSSIDPIMNPANARNNVMTRLVEGLFMDKIKKRANKKSTINGLKICSFNMTFLLRKLKKFSLG
jgi:hypothetical protein